MNNAEPISFSCPSCGAKYKIVAIDSSGAAHRGKVACLRCDALFVAGNEHAFFKYILVGPPGNKGKQR